MRLEHLQLFLKIVDCGSLAGAARASGLSATTVSERLAGLEHYYGARLFNRTTRALNLTDAGRTLVERAPRLLADADALRSRIRAGSERVAGPLRVSAPVDFGRARLAPILDRFVEMHPGITAELILTDGYVDMVTESVDVAVRLGALQDSSLRVRRLGDNRRVVCASPAYLERRTAPVEPADLADHNCLCMRFGQQLDREWRFLKAGRDISVRVSGDRIANDGALVRQWCLRGYGVALKSQWDVADDLAAGRLVELLAAFSRPAGALQLVFPPGRGHPRRVRVFADTVVAALGSQTASSASAAKSRRRHRR